MLIDFRSFERAIEAIKFFDKYIPRKAAKVTDVCIVNRLFSQKDKISSTFEEFFDEREPVRLMPVELIEGLKEGGVKAQDAKEKLLALIEQRSQQMNEPFPEIERLPTNYYEDGIKSLEFVLKSRQIIAFQHWKGNVNYNYGNFVQEMLSQRQI